MAQQGRFCCRVGESLQNLLRVESTSDVDLAPGKKSGLVSALNTICRSRGYHPSDDLRDDQ